MNNNRRRIHELELLSAYLDDELNPNDREQVKARLAREPELRERLENLRRTKITLGSLARLKAPRNFTLTPEMVSSRQKKRKPLFTFLKLASSFAAIVLVLLVGLELVLGGRLGVGAQLAAEASLQEADTFMAEGTPEPLILWGDSESGGAEPKDSVTGYGGAGDFVPESEEQPEMIEEAAPMEESNEEVPPSVETEGEMTEEQKISKAAEDIEESPILGLNPEEGGETLSRSEAPTLADKTKKWDWGALRWIEIALAVIALGGIIAYWLLRRK